MKGTLSQLQQTMIVQLVNKAQLNYQASFLTLYSAYNAWYRSVTGTPIDANALQSLKGRHQIWQDYLNDECMRNLGPVMRKLYVLTAHRPLGQTPNQPQVRLDDPTDWRSLIDFWYAVRCDIIHANDGSTQVYFPIYCQLAYESLNIFMVEVVGRLQLTVGMDASTTLLTSADARRMIYTPPKEAVDITPKRRFERLRLFHNQSEA